MSVIDQDSLKNFIDRIYQFKQSGLTNSEANTKKRLIEPLIELLGWSFDTNEIQLEYQVTMGTSKPRVDYAFLIEGKPTFLLEAKPFDSELSKSESDQCISYGKVSDIRWVALTNGDKLILFDTSRGINSEQCTISTIKLGNLPEGINELSLLHRDIIITGEIDTIVDRVSETKNAIQNLKKNQDLLKEKFKQSILDITGDILKERVESASIQLSKQAIQILDEQTESIHSSPKPKQSQKVPEIKRSELATYPRGEVILTPAKPKGVEFLRKYNAWGFVKTTRTPRYFALYVGKPVSSLLYFAEIKKITDPIEDKKELNQIQEKDLATFKKGRRVIWLKEGSLRKFIDPIPLIDNKRALRGPIYISLEKITKAKKITDLYNQS